MKIPDCYEADRQAEALDLAHTKKVTRRPRCCKCGSFLAGEVYLDLSEFGMNETYACQRCADAATLDVEELDE